MILETIVGHAHLVDASVEILSALLAMATRDTLRGIVWTCICVSRLPRLSGTDKYLQSRVVSRSYLAFKDFGGRLYGPDPLTGNLLRVEKISESLTATSGDTGGRLWHMPSRFIDNIVWWFYIPKAKSASYGEVCFSHRSWQYSLSAIEAEFWRVSTTSFKTAFDECGCACWFAFKSGQFYNISRLFAQVVLLLWRLAQLLLNSVKDVVVSVPSGNFGNLYRRYDCKGNGFTHRPFLWLAEQP